MIFIVNYLGWFFEGDVFGSMQNILGNAYLNSTTVLFDKNISTKEKEKLSKCQD